MTMPEIGRLERVSLRTIWPHEEYHFTPWLVENLDQLSETLDIPLDDPKRETWLPGAGEVDILAKVRTESGEETANVVIENQYGESDEDHFRRLLGYAASSDASILIWVAERFTSGHIRMVQWLNQWGADGNKIYAVEARALRIGAAFAVDFHIISGPRIAQERQKRNAVASIATAYAEFYRPVVAQLRREGLPPVSRGGWRGRWRSFQTGYPDIFYSVGLEDGGEARAYFEVSGRFEPSGGDVQAVYEALHQFRTQIDTELGDGEVEWRREGRTFWIATKTEASLDDPEEKHDETRSWMFDNLLKIKRVIQPRLDQIMTALHPEPNEMLVDEETQTSTSDGVEAGQ